MNEPAGAQYQLDFRTGRPTAIKGPRVSPEERAACAALNRQRARGITEAARLTPSRESLSPDVWAAIFARQARAWGVPLIPLESLGIEHDDDGLIVSKFLRRLKSGAEAHPFEDLEWNVVYKLFPLNLAGGLGKKIVFEYEDEETENRPDVRVVDAVLFDTIDKLTMLHEAGAHATELVGLDFNGDYLLVKQPLAVATETYEADCAEALQQIKAVTPRAPMRRSLSVVWVRDEAWFVSDLHRGNIMRDGENLPTIIDALVGAVPPSAIQCFGWLSNAVSDAKAFRELGYPPRRLTIKDVDEDLL